MGRSRTDYSFLNIVAGIGGYFLNTIMGFICRIIFTRCLAEEYLGISGLFTNILTMLSLAELGIGSAIVYALYKPLAENDQSKIRALVQFYRKAYMVIGVVVALIGLATSLFYIFFHRYLQAEESFLSNRAYIWCRQGRERRLGNRRLFLRQRSR